MAAEAASGSGWRCAGLSRDELVGLLRQWQALESWAAAAKLGVLRALIREDDQPLPGGGYRGDLPEGWTKSLTHEVAAALAMSVVSAENLMWLAFDLEVALPGIGELLAAGDLSLAKARAVDQALGQLTDEDTVAAEAMLLPMLGGKTYGQVAALAAQAAITVDPDSAARRREDAERTKCRVQVFREESGAAGLSGRDLPTGQTLAAHARVCERAAEYKDSGAFGEARMDQLRAAAYLDLINGITADARIASGQLVTASGTSTPPPAPAPADAPPSAPVSLSDRPDDADRGDAAPGTADPDGRGPSGDSGGSSSDGGGSSGDAGGPSGDGHPDGGPSDGGPGEPASPPRLADLVLPLATLLGLGERPGEGHRLGPLDPALCRELAAAATASPWSRLCVTVTNADGIAIGHGCARPARRRDRRDRPGNDAAMPLALTLPARIQLTITASRLKDLAGTSGVTGTTGVTGMTGMTGPPGTAGPPGPAAWSLTRDGDCGPGHYGPGSCGPPDGLGRWTLTLPDGRRLDVALEPVPTFDCDHRHESHAYQPNDTLRHLVQVRDGECTFPPCSRHARETDFEHAVPFGKGGRTCGCNAGSRSRQCHRVKQSPGWTLTQPKPGWHQWTTPAGRSYTQGPKHYTV